jgi:hypothetical protein
MLLKNNKAIDFARGSCIMVPVELIREYFWRGVLVKCVKRGSGYEAQIFI